MFAGTITMRRDARGVSGSSAVSVAARVPAIRSSAPASALCTRLSTKAARAVAGAGDHERVVLELDRAAGARHRGPVAPLVGGPRQEDLGRRVRVGEPYGRRVLHGPARVPPRLEVRAHRPRSLPDPALDDVEDVPAGIGQDAAASDLRIEPPVLPAAAARDRRAGTNGA